MGYLNMQSYFCQWVVIVICLGVISHIIQSGVVISKESFKPKVFKVKSCKWFKKYVFTKSLLLHALKNTILLILLSYIGYSVVKKNFMDILKLENVYFPYLIYAIFNIVKKTI